MIKRKKFYSVVQEKGIVGLRKQDGYEIKAELLREQQKELVQREIEENGGRKNVKTSNMLQSRD